MFYGKRPQLDNFSLVLEEPEPAFVDELNEFRLVGSIQALDFIICKYHMREILDSCELLVYWHGIPSLENGRKHNLGLTFAEC